MPMTPISVVAYVVLFATVAFLVLFVMLLVGRLLRPSAPSPEKLQTYECGEPAVGSAFVQFDLRFYVVALVFIIFEVEVAFFFPWATAFGKVVQLLRPDAATATPAATYRALGIPESEVPAAASQPGSSPPPITGAARRLAVAAMADIALFFGILLVGFAYVWKRGDLTWVRAAGRPPSASDVNTSPH
jgi:NADH-quinone oxidoreductase subunit A